MVLKIQCVQFNRTISLTNSLIWCIGHLIPVSNFMNSMNIYVRAAACGEVLSHKIIMSDLNEDLLKPNETKTSALSNFVKNHSSCLCLNASLNPLPVMRLQL